MALTCAPEACTRGRLLASGFAHTPWPSGNNYGLGETRKLELKGSCEALGIDVSRCEALDHPDLQDNPKVWWDTSIIQSIIRDHVRKWDIDAASPALSRPVASRPLTTSCRKPDHHVRRGRRVRPHQPPCRERRCEVRWSPLAPPLIPVTYNRVKSRATANASVVSEYVVNDAKAPAAYKLVTTAVLRKYTVLLDLPLTALSFAWRIAAAICFPSSAADPKYSDKALVASTWHRYLRTRNAFASHGSQYSWDRHLYMVLSRYVWFNGLERIAGRGAAP